MMLPLLLALAAPPALHVDRDDVLIRESCTVTIANRAIDDAKSDGVIQIVGENIVVDFAGAILMGAPLGRPQDGLRGVGVSVRGAGITVKNLRLDGFKVGLLAEECPGLSLESIDVVRGFAQRLKSTPKAEEGGDWLWPHRNDENEWRTNYGASICVKGASGATLRGIRVRHAQNGIILDRVVDSRLYDCDCSFLSGWGLAMWRSSRNMISRNAFDFCVRGYSHGIYNRGQDSAGILLFEQCCENRFVENSVTHGGDGVFAFAGREALGEAPLAGAAEDFHAKRGCNGNIFVSNDLSYAAAHGLELTFSFDNTISGNRFEQNAICGIWGGYSQQTFITTNHFSENGDGAYGLERGGINIEHGMSNLIATNVFTRNGCGVHLWWDADEGLMKLPWARANEAACRGNVIVGNSFNGDAVGIHLRDAERTTIAGNRFSGVAKEREIDEKSKSSIVELAPASMPTVPRVEAIGDARPVAARRELAGRAKIMMTEWGPYDHVRPLLSLISDHGCLHHWRAFGVEPTGSMQVTSRGPLRGIPLPNGEGYLVSLAEAGASPGWVLPYSVRIPLKHGQSLEGSGILVDCGFTVRAFNWTNDPREKLDAWRAEAAQGVELSMRSLSVRFGGGGPAALAADATPEPSWPDCGNALEGVLRERLSALKPDRFGIVATAKVNFPAGTWTLRVRSDDGVRVSVDGRPIVENWTWHAPTTDTGTFALEKAGVVELAIEYFELDGHAELSLEVEAAS